MWGQTQGPDIKGSYCGCIVLAFRLGFADNELLDVTDRLAYLNFVHGALSYTLATNIDK